MGPYAYLSEIKEREFNIENSYLIIYKKNTEFTDPIMHKKMAMNFYDGFSLLRLDFNLRFEKKLRNSFLPYYDYRIILEDSICFDITDIVMIADTLTHEEAKKTTNGLVSFKSNGQVIPINYPGILVIPYSTRRIIKENSSFKEK